MEFKEVERVVIARPVASRPTCSNFRSVSEVIVATNISPPNICSETAVAAIRPKTVRFKPVMNPAPAALVSSQGEVFGAAACDSSNKLTTSASKTTVIYKPQAKLVPKTTVSVLENKGSISAIHQQTLPSVEACVQLPSQDKQNFTSQLTSNIHRNIQSHAEADITMDPSRLTPQNLEEDPKTLPSVANVDRPSYDGYNWRKYGQKQVKGSEYPRSYYKCTHPNCPVKKKVERSFNGEITEIVYNGEHNHSKPQTPKRNSSGTQVLGLVSEGSGQDANDQSLSNHLNERNESSEGGVKNQNETGLPAHSTYHGEGPPSYDPARTGLNNAGAGTSDDNSCGLSGECDEGSKRLEGDDDDDDDERKSKRRKFENQNQAGISGDGAQEPSIVLQSSTDSEIVGDGFRWRKYGQKVVKGNSYPRSYYRCTSLKCNVRKHVERASDDPTSFITTYEGKHNHEMPRRSTNPAASESELQALTSRGRP